jgi:hypothetical protein
VIVEAIQRLASAVNGWAIGVLDRRRERAMLKAFPVGARVRLYPTCDCGKRAIATYYAATGKLIGDPMGTVEALSDASDYRVHVDGTYDDGAHRDYEYVCPKGMVRA